MKLCATLVCAAVAVGCVDGSIENENKVTISGGISVVQFPTASEGMGTTGILSVLYDDLPLTPALAAITTVTVNGVVVPPLPLPEVGKYDVSKVTVVGAAPGMTVKVEVKVVDPLEPDDVQNDGYDLACPPAVILNSPEDGAMTMNGLMLNVGWIGDIDYGNGPLLGPTLSVYEYSPPPVNRRFDITPAVSLPVSGISQPLTMPATGPSMGTQFLIELLVPGRAVDLARKAACTLVRRVRLSKT